MTEKTHHYPKKWEYSVIANFQSVMSRGTLILCKMYGLKSTEWIKYFEKGWKAWENIKNTAKFLEFNENLLISRNANGITKAKFPYYRNLIKKYCKTRFPRNIREMCRWKQKELRKFPFEE